jgi:hypothetical protein
MLSPGASVTRSTSSFGGSIPGQKRKIMMKTANILLIALYLAYSFVEGETGECTVLEDGATECRHKDGDRRGEDRAAGVVIGGHLVQRCQAPPSLYSRGGTAVAYRTNARTQTNICSIQQQQPQKSKYKVASWFGRRATWSQAPRITLTVHVHACRSSPPPEDNDTATAAATTCACHKLDDDSSSSLVSVEVWQTRPDGTYPSLHQQNNNDNDDNSDNASTSDECRAQQTGSSATFETLAPGSVGSMVGLGPSGWEFGPYRPPVFHILVRGPPGYAATLVDLPIAVHPQTLEKTIFSGPDLSGPAWTRRKEAKLPYSSSSTQMYEITSWTARPAEHRAEVVVDVFLPQSASSNNDDDWSLCPSRWYGIPRSFFTEPITLCAPTLLNFFPL